MAFSGTLEKCKACDKTVYFVDQLTADGIFYHKACFRCHHCNRTLQLSDYSSFEGTPYCKPHFEQLFKLTGSFEKNFEAGKPLNKLANDIEKSTTRSKASYLFSGTQDKCVACMKTVYPLEKVSVEGSIYHKSCFKCSHGGCLITTSNYSALEGRLYCRHHFSQLFMEKGNFSQLVKIPPVKSQNGVADF